MTLGLYRAVCDIRATLCPALPPLSDYTDLTPAYLDDLAALDTDTDA